MIVFDELAHFGADEFDHPDRMQRLLLLRLDRVRASAGVPIHITSDFRPGDDKAHGRGWAVDISDNLEGRPISSRWRMKVTDALRKHGVRRIGQYDRHLHADLDPELPQNVMWWGKSD